MTSSDYTSRARTLLAASYEAAERGDHTEADKLCRESIRCIDRARSMGQGR